MDIHVLSEDTINKIAAGEVVERPVNVAKELIENAIDAGATAISCEIRDGGTTMIRVTDNGCGIEPSQITKAFMRHATSKISGEEDLSRLSTLGFRGEALSSIASVAEVEMITKTRDRLTGIRAVNSGLCPNNTDVIPLEISEVGAPDGTTVIVRNLFYNVPVRRKFLKSTVTEAGYISDLIEHMALSHPHISFHFRANGREKLHTSGSGNIREIIYRIYGREIANTILPVDVEDEARELKLSGFIGRPEISRGTRSFEVFFVNGRVLESPVLSRGLESGYRTDLMQHQFPFAILYLTMPPAMADVNVHPSKKEVRFSDSQRIYDFLDTAVHRTLHREELIPMADLRSDAEIRKEEEASRHESNAPHEEPFEIAGIPQRQGLVFQDGGVVTYKAPESNRPDSIPAVGSVESMHAGHPTLSAASEEDRPADKITEQISRDEVRPEQSDPGDQFFIDHLPDPRPVQAECAQEPRRKENQTISPLPPAREHLLTPERAETFHIVGQIFRTYWIIETGKRLLLVDQHAAHEKVRYEHLMHQYRMRQQEPVPSQMLMPPAVITFSGKEEACFLDLQTMLASMGFETENLGGGSYAIRAVPLELYGSSPVPLLQTIIDEHLSGKMGGDPQDILARIATESCRGAVKGGDALSAEEAKALIREMLTLDNPYHCPHGRPTCIELTEQDIERRFRRIV